MFASKVRGRSIEWALKGAALKRVVPYLANIRQARKNFQRTNTLAYLSRTPVTYIKVL